jgi:probable F420-dependent oxidoreductase
MTEKRKFRFGAQVRWASSSKEWSETARAIEDMGYSTLLLPDHFMDNLEPLSALAFAASATTTLRVGTLVLDNDFRHPAMLAKEAATLDLFSDGRLELGLGAGWMVADYEKSGIPFEPAAVRMDRFEEALAIIKGLFGKGPFSFTGKHYTVTGLDGLPKPVQRPIPPLLIGAGSKRMLQIAAREADIVNISFSGRAGALTPEFMATGRAGVMDEKLKIVGEAAGDRLPEIELSLPVFFGSVTDNPGAEAERLGSSLGMGPDDVLALPHALIGSVDGLVEELERRREEYGFSYIILGRELPKAMAPVVARLAGK